MSSLMAVLAVVWALPQSSNSPVRMDLIINGATRGEVTVIVRDDDVLAPALPELTRTTRGAAEVIDGETYVSLKSLAPEISYRIDEEQVALVITLNDLRALPMTAIDARPASLDPTLIRRDTSAFLNYDVELQNLKRGLVNLEGGFTLGPGVLTSSATAGQFQSYVPVRGLTTWTMDDRDALRRISIGDNFLQTGTLGGAGYFGGVVLTRAFGLDPFYLAQPTLGVTGAAAMPSTLDVYVGNVLMRRENIPAGPFKVSGLPMIEGSSVTRYVLRDAFGRTTDVSLSQYGARRLLAQGVSDYVASVGAMRRSFGKESFDYDPTPTFLGRYRYGLTDSLTVDSRLELNMDLTSTGLAGALRTNAGVFGVTVAGSKAGDIVGGAAQVDYAYYSRKLSLSLTAIGTSRDYVTTSLTRANDRALLDVGGTVAFPIFRVASLSASFERSYMRDTGTRDTGTLAVSVLFGGSWMALATASRITGTSDPALQAAITLRYVFSGGASAGAGARASSANGVEATADLQKPTPITGGLGYRAQVAGTDKVDQGSAEVVYQARWARFDARADKLEGGGTTTTLAMNGSIIGVKGAGAYATRAVRDSFAVVQVPERKGVRVYLDNRDMGTTDTHGNVIMPELTPYYPHRFAIADADLSIEETLPSVERKAALTLRSGALLRFDVKRSHFLRGSLTIAGKPPAYGEMSVKIDKNHTLVSPLGSEGEFELQDAPAGWYFADVTWSGGRCTAILEVTDTGDFVTELGTLACAPEWTS